MGRSVLHLVAVRVSGDNAQGGYLRRKAPFELVVKNDNSLWGSSGNVITDMANKDNVWAILGTVDEGAKILNQMRAKGMKQPFFACDRCVTGDIVFSAVMDNMREVYLAKYEGGKWNYHIREDLAIPRGQQWHPQACPAA